MQSTFSLITFNVRGAQRFNRDGISYRLANEGQDEYWDCIPAGNRKW